MASVSTSHKMEFPKQMPDAHMPLPDKDYEIMNVSWQDFVAAQIHLPEKTKLYVTNVNHRLAEVAWLTEKLEEEFAVPYLNQVPGEGLLSLQMYLLLTCADSLSHIDCPNCKVGERFNTYFENLPQAEKVRLADDILAWKTDDDWKTYIVQDQPLAEQVERIVRQLSFDERFSATIDFLYMWRNYYTHEANYPEDIYKPTLTTMLKSRLGLSDFIMRGKRDRFHAMISGKHTYLTYYETNDVIATVRRSILIGLGEFIAKCR